MSKQSRRDETLTRVMRGRYEERQNDEENDFFGVWAKLENVTPQLIDELVSRGWDRQQIEILVKEGWKYNRRRDSLMLQGGGK